MTTSRALFDSRHVYSTAREAAAKRRLDEQIIGGDFSRGGMVDLANEGYLKELVRLASKRTLAVSASAKKLQFFIIKGGGEGFLDTYYTGKDASRVTVGGGVTTSGKPGTVMIFDDNDIIMVFDRSGTLISSALLSRPLSIANPNIWTEKTANKVYDAWDGQSVSIYRNTQFDIKYYGLVVNDRLGLYSSGRVRVDLHKQEATNGCIFIKDDNTPAYADQAKLNAFEPQFILDVQKAIKAKSAWNIGLMRVIEIK